MGKNNISFEGIENSINKNVDLCHISTTFNRKSGSAKRTLAIAEYMVCQGWTVLLIFGPDNDMENYTGPVPWVAVKGLHKPISLLNDIYSGISLLTILKKVKPKIIHTHLAKAGILGRFISIFLPKATVVMHTVHGPTFDPSVPWLNRELYRFLETKMASFTDVQIYVGKGLQKTYQNKNVKGAKREEVIYTGKNLHFATPLHRQLPANEIQAYSLLYVGRIVPVKQHLHAIRLVDKLIKAGYDVTLDIVGAALTHAEISHEQKILKHVKELCLEDRISFLGHIDDVSVCYQRADLCLLTSAYEGLPNVVVESLINGTPIVSYDVCGIEELLADTLPDLIVEKNNESLLFEVVKSTLCSLPSVNEGVLESQKKIGEAFDMGRMLKAKHTLYSEYTVNK